MKSPNPSLDDAFPKLRVGLMCGGARVLQDLRKERRKTVGRGRERATGRERERG